MRLHGLISTAGFLLVIAGLLSSSIQLNASPYQSVDPRLIARAEQVTGDKFPVATLTPMGVKVLSVNSPSKDVLTAIDKGFADLFAVAHRHNYARKTRFSDYTVFIARADRTKDSAGQYSPDIAVAAGQYAGSDYDQGGYIYAAGMVLAFNPSAFVFAEHERDFTRISNVVRFEGEHIILYYNDRVLYEKTADHSRGGGHPILN